MHKINLKKTKTKKLKNERKKKHEFVHKTQNNFTKHKIESTKISTYTQKSKNI